MNGQRPLMAGILQDAIDSFSIRVTSPTARDEERAREAEAWIFSDDRSSPYTFRNVCDVLDLDASRIRDLLLRWRRVHPLPVVGVPVPAPEAGARVATR